MVILQRKEIREIGIKIWKNQNLAGRSDGDFRIVMHRTPVCACRTRVIQVEVCQHAEFIVGEGVFIGQIRMDLFDASRFCHLIEFA